MARKSTYEITLEHAEAEVKRLKLALADAEATVRFCRAKVAVDKEGPALELLSINANLSGKPLPAAIRAVLDIAGKPLKTSEIVESLLAGGVAKRENLTASVTAALNRRDDLFERTALATYTLKNGVHETNPASL